MLPNACHLFCIARGDLGSLKVRAPSVSLAYSFFFYKKVILNREIRGGSFSWKLLKDSSTTNLSVGGAGRSTPSIIGSHNTFSCFLPFLPSCDILYLSLLSVNIFPIWSFLHSATLSLSLFLCLSLCRSLPLFYSHMYAHTYPGKARQCLSGRKRIQAFSDWQASNIRICY